MLVIFESELSSQYCFPLTLLHQCSSLLLCHPTQSFVRIHFNSPRLNISSPQKVWFLFSPLSLTEVEVQKDCNNEHQEGQIYFGQGHNFSNIKKKKEKLFFVNATSCPLDRKWTPLATTAVSCCLYLYIWYRTVEISLETQVLHCDTLKKVLNKQNLSTTLLIASILSVPANSAFTMRPQMFSSTERSLQRCLLSVLSVGISVVSWRTHPLMIMTWETRTSPRGQKEKGVCPSSFLVFSYLLIYYIRYIQSIWKSHVDLQVSNLKS